MIARLLVLSLFEAFLSASMARSIAAEKTMVAEFLTDHAESPYPSSEEMMQSPMNGDTAL